MASSTATSTATSIDLRRTRRIIATQLGRSIEFRGTAIFVKDAPPYEDERAGAASLAGKSNAGIWDPDTDLRLDALLKIILDVFTRDIATDNSLALNPRIKTDFRSLPIVGVGTSYIVRKLFDVPVGARGSGSIASSRIGEKFLTEDHRIQEKPRVSKQLKALRSRRHPDRRRRLLDGTMTELCILTHHPLKMHDNILDFLGVMWEYDDEWRVWPVLILEFADMGTLTKCLASPETFTFAQKMELCLDIGNGLDALHSCGVSHGDIKPDNIFVFRHENRGFTAKLGDFSTSLTEVAMRLNPREALKMGGFTPLWVAPEHPEISTFARLLSMDIFSYGLCVWAVVENGDLPLAAVTSRGGDAMAALRESKRFPKVVYHAVRSAQRPGICEDIDLELFSSILKTTLCRADDRNLRRALELLQSFCIGPRQSLRSPLRPILSGDIVSSAMPKTLREPLKNIDMRVLKELPRPLLIQLRSRLEKGSTQPSPHPPMTTRVGTGWDLCGEELHQSQWSSVLFSLQLENLGSWTLLETEARRGTAPFKIRIRPGAAKFLGGHAEGQNSEKRLNREILEKSILGSVCDGSPDFSADRYAFCRNEKTSSAVSYLFRNNPVDIGETPLAFSAAMALKQTYPMETLGHCSKMSVLIGMHSLLRKLGMPFSERLDKLQFLARTPMAEPMDDMINSIQQDMQNRLEPESVSLPANITALLLGEENAGSSESLASLAALISRIPQLRERVRISNPQELDESNALLNACQFGNLEAARLLLAHGARAAVTNDRGLGPLHFLSSIDPVEQGSIARELVAAGANPNRHHSGLGTRHIVSPVFLQISTAPGTPLHHAVLNNDLAAVKVLIECGSMPLVAGGKEFLTPLALAAALHCPETLRILLDASAIDISKWYDHYGNNLVCAALDSQWNTLRMGIHLDEFYAKTKETLEMLWELGADFGHVSYMWQIPALHYACKMASVNVVALLLEMGLKHQINKPLDSVNLPLHEALETGNEHLVLLLLDQGADINLHGKDDAYCLHQAIKSGTATEDATDRTVIFFMDLLLDRGANINEISRGRTALHQAVAGGLYGVAGHLLDRGADMDPRLDEGLTMLGMLVLHEDRPMPALLSLLEPVHPFDRPGHIVGPDQLSALHLTAGAYTRANPGGDDDSEVLEYLLLRLPNAEHLECAWGKWGLTPLMIAVVTGNVKATRLLIEAGASVKAKAKFGWSLLYFLRHDQVLEALVRFRIAFVDTVSSYPGIGKPNLTFDKVVLPDILKAIRDAFLRPRQPPLSYPPGTSKASRSSRVKAFLKLVRQHNISDAELQEGGGRLYLKKADVDSNRRMLDISAATLSELTLVLHEDLVRCPFIVQVSAYSWARTDIKSPYRPALLWKLDPNEAFITLSSHLQHLRGMFYECGVYICCHVAAGLDAVHNAGFTHGRLDLGHVRIRGIIEDIRDTSRLRPLTAQLWDFDCSSNMREDPAYHVYFRSRSRTPFEAPELGSKPANTTEKFETLKKYDTYALAVLILCVLGEMDPDRVPPTGMHRAAAIDAAISKLAERSRASKTGNATTVHLIPPLRKLLSEDLGSRPANVAEVLAALQTLQSVADGMYTLYTSTN